MNKESYIHKKHSWITLICFFSLQSKNSCVDYIDEDIYKITNSELTALGDAMILALLCGLKAQILLPS